MNSSCLLVLLALALPLSAVAAEEAKPATPTPTFYVDDPAKWARPTKTFPPEFPDALFNRGVTGYVDAKVRISPLGRALEVISVTSEPKVPEFEIAVAEVIKSWEFRESLGPDCGPIEAVGNTRVSFDIKSGQKSVSVLRVERPARGKDAVGPRLNNRSQVQRVLKENFPRSARRLRAGAKAWAIIEVDGNTGEALSVTTSAMVASKELAGNFAEAIRLGLEVATFTVEPELRDQKLRACMVINFKIQN